MVPESGRNIAICQKLGGCGFNKRFYYNGIFRYFELTHCVAIHKR